MTAWVERDQSQPVIRRLLPLPLAAVGGEGVVAHEGDAAEVDVDVDRVLAAGAAHDPDEPGVEALPGGGRLLLGPRLDALRDPERDASQVAVLLLGRGRRRRRRGRLRASLPAARSRRRSRSSRPLSRTSTLPSGSSAVISAAAWEMASIRASRALGSSAYDEPLGRLLELVAARLGRGDEVATQAVDVGGDVHVHHSDITVTSCQHHCDVTWCRRDITPGVSCARDRLFRDPPAARGSRNLSAHARAD